MNAPTLEAEKIRKPKQNKEAVIAVGVLPTHLLRPGHTPVLNCDCFTNPIMYNNVGDEYTNCRCTVTMESPKPNWSSYPPEKPRDLASEPAPPGTLKVDVGWPM